MYPLGCKVVIQNWKTNKQVFLSGHTNAISAIAISPNGKYVASGQINHMGFKVSEISLRIVFPSECNIANFNLNCVAYLM